MKEHDRNITNNCIDTIVIGGGISGVSFASKLKTNNLDYLLIDDTTNSGCTDTFNTKEIWCEMGAHTLYNSYSNTIEYLNDNHLTTNIVKRKKYPFLFINESNQISSIFKNINFFELIKSYITNRKTTKDNKTIQEYAEKIFGIKNYSDTLKYCFDAVLSQNSRLFPMNYLFKKYKRNKSYPRTFTIDGGLSTLVNIDLNKISSRVMSIIKENDLWVVKTLDKEYKCTNVCIATSWDITSSLLNNILPNSASHIYQPQISKIMSVAIIVNKDTLKKLNNISGLIGKKQFFYSVISRDIIDHKNLRALTFHCKSIANSENEILKNITNILNINADQILNYNFKTNVLPMYNVKHNIFIKNLENDLKSSSGLYITGNFFDRLAIENCIKRSNEEINRLISDIRINHLIIPPKKTIM